MQSYVFRNSTVEHLFSDKNTDFSGYDDVSIPKKIYDNYIWFYLVPIKYDLNKLTNEIDYFLEKILFIKNALPNNKRFIIFSLEATYYPNLSEFNEKINIKIKKTNAEIIDISEQTSAIKFLDFSEFVHQFDSNKIIDWKYYFISKMQISPILTKDFKTWFDKKLLQMNLIRKKCIVLDLDNTLWGGILGEDGLHGVKIGGGYPGNVFEQFQQALLKLSNTGVLLAICSKNNEKDVLELWEKNHFMIIKQSDVSTYRINWENKADNIKSIAEELNLGLDSFVFIDDSPTERELVKQLLPMVSTPEFPKHPYFLLKFFAEICEEYFKINILTREDLNKKEQYKNNLNRKKLESSFKNIDDYIKSLDITLNIQYATKLTIPRIAQLTQKTNQFNLTTKRYTDANLQKMLNDNHVIYALDVKDKFDNQGLTGIIIIKKISAHEANIDSFLLSCRILGRGIETCFLNHVLMNLKNTGINTVYSDYLLSDKNTQVKDFYINHNFKLLRQDENKNSQYMICLDDKNILNKEDSIYNLEGII